MLLPLPLKAGLRAERDSGLKLFWCKRECWWRPAIWQAGTPRGRKRAMRVVFHVGGRICSIRSIQSEHNDQKHNDLVNPGAGEENGVGSSSFLRGWRGGADSHAVVILWRRQQIGAGFGGEDLLVD
ncbi:unnamed protein product [Calypogeia fissa]